MEDAHEIATFLLRRGLILATAESCTAGLMASRIAEVSGSGRSLCLAIVTYAPEAKIDVLGVPQETIARYGLTSEAVSLAMARGVMNLCKADLAVANTGVLIQVSRMKAHRTIRPAAPNVMRGFSGNQVSWIRSWNSAKLSASTEIATQFAKPQRIGGCCVFAITMPRHCGKRVKARKLF